MKKQSTEYEFSKKHPDFETIWWLSSFKPARDETRHHVLTIQVKDGVGVATNGAAILVATITTDIDDGDYLIDKRTKAKIILKSAQGNWPKWEQLFDGCPIAHNSRKDKFFMVTDPTHLEEVDDFDRAVTYFYRDYYLNVTKKKAQKLPVISSGYLRQAFGGFDCRSIYLFIKKMNAKDDALVFSDAHAERAAIIMPIRP